MNCDSFDNDMIKASDIYVCILISWIYSNVNVNIVSLYTIMLSEC